MQGDMLSPMLFSNYIDRSLGANSNKYAFGYLVNRISFDTPAYSDDMTIFCLFYRSFNNLFHIAL